MRREIAAMTAVVISAVVLAVAYGQETLVEVGVSVVDDGTEDGGSTGSWTHFLAGNVPTSYDSDIPKQPEAQPKEAKTRTMPMHSVGRMMQSLQQQTDDFDYAMAVSYIRGVDAGMWATIDCYVGITEETNGDLAMAWVWFALQNPEVWQLNMAVAGLTYGMLKQSFPCKTEEEDGQGSGDPEAPAPTGGSGQSDQ